MKFFIPFLIVILTGNNCLSQSFSSLAVFVSEQETGKPVPSASVIIKEAGWASKTTGIDGKVFFDKSMPIGEIHYIVSKEGYQGIEGSLNITTEEKSNSLNIKLSKFRDDRLLITGEVVDENERDLEGAIVEVKVADIIKSMKTDAGGNYKIEININEIKFDPNVLKIEVKYNNGCKKSEIIDLTRKNVIYKDFKLACASENSVNPENSPGVTHLGQDEVAGLRISVTKCELVGKKLVCYLLYENISNDPSKRFSVCGTNNKMIDENGLIYKCSANSVGNVERQGSGCAYCDIISGTKVKGKTEFIVGDTNFSKIASMEIYTKAIRTHKFYNIKVLK